MTEVEASGGYCGGDGLEGAKRHTPRGRLASSTIPIAKQGASAEIVS